MVKFHEVFEDETHKYIVMEYCKKGDLLDHIVKSDRLSEEKATNLFRQLVCAIFYLHDRNIAHRDISPESILLDANDQIKLCDFGQAVTVKPGVKRSIKNNMCPGKTGYRSPEVLRCQHYDPRALDVWSCGVTLFIMLVGVHPYQCPKSIGAYAAAAPRAHAVVISS